MKVGKYLRAYGLPLVGLLIFLNVSTAHSETFEFDWESIPIANLPSKTFQFGDLVINNCMVSQKPNMMYGNNQVIRVECSARNGSDKVAILTLQIFGLDKESKITFATSINPMMGRVVASKVEQMSQNIVDERTISGTDVVWVRIFGSFK
jgi:hypothetical protein